MKKRAQDRQRRRHPRFDGTEAALLILFLLSGGCALIYEVTWSRMLVTILGGTVFAISTVLTSFMAGLALGSFYGGRLIDRSTNPLRVYGVLEAGIGLYAILLPLVLSGMGNLYVHIHRPLSDSFYLLILIRFILSFIILLIPASLMGATFPVMSRFFVRRLRSLGRGVASLYSANTFGAVVGAFLTGYFLLGAIGVRGSIYVAAGTNLLISGTALVLSRRQVPVRRREEVEVERTGRRVAEPGGAQVYPAPVTSLVLLGFALSGFAALAYEVLWTRVLSFFLENNTSYAFATMLVSFLFGLALGSFAFGSFIDRRRNPLLLFGLVEIGIGVVAPLSIFTLGRLSNIVERVGMALIPSPTFWGYTGMRFLASFLVMLLPTVLMGAAFPLVSKIYTRSLSQLGRRIGSVYSVNTLGCIFGSFAAGFVLIPLLGTQRSILAVALLNVSIGGTLVYFNPRLPSRAKHAMLAGAILIAGSLSTFFPREVFTHIFDRSRPDSRLLYYEEGATGTVTVHEDRESGLQLSINGVTEVPLDYQSFQTFRMLGHLPLLLHPNPKRVLTIAFGGGIALGAVAQHSIDEVDCVEICPGVLSASDYFTGVNHRVLENPRVNLVIDDGRNYVLTSDKVYDVITGDATHPRAADSWVLYTEEFYELCRDRLAEDGVMCQWLPLHGLAEEDYKTILKTFSSVFPHSTLWFTNNFTIMIGTPGKLKIDFSLLRERMKEESVRLSLGEVSLADPVAFLSTFIMDEDAIKKCVADAGTNSDDRPQVVSAESRAYGRNTVIENIWGINTLRGRVLPFLTDLGETEEEVQAVKAKFEKYYKSRRHNILARLYWVSGVLSRAVSEYEEAISENPEDEDARHLLREVKEVYDLAEMDMRRRVELYPRDPAGHSILGYVYFERGSLDEAIGEFKKALEIEPDLAAVRIVLGEIYLGKGRVDEAIEQLKKAIAIEPERAKAHLGLGDAYRSKGMLGQAISEYETAIEIDPRSGRTYLSLGYAHQLRGDDQEAIEAYRTSIELSPSPHAHDNLATIYANRGELESAIGEWEKAILIDPDYGPAKEKMERARRMMKGE